MSTEAGKEAEELVARFLEAQGHTVIAMNWKTRWCEIDVVSTHKKIAYFTEVKYRSSYQWGHGADYVMNKKIKQMHFAAEMWLHNNNWKHESQLQVASVNPNMEIELLQVN